MPREKVLSRAISNFLWQCDFAPVQRIVLSPVLEVSLEPPADFDAVLGRYGDVAAIEERVSVAAQQQSVVDTMLAAFGIWPDMRGLEMLSDGRSRYNCTTAGHPLQSPRI